MGKYEVTVSVFREFINATGYKTEAERTGGAFIRGKNNWGKKEGIFWANPGILQNDNHPVTCVSWNDVMEFCEWLTDLTGICTVCQQRLSGNMPAGPGAQNPIAGAARWTAQRPCSVTTP